LQGTQPFSEEALEPVREIRGSSGGQTRAGREEVKCQAAERAGRELDLDTLWAAADQSELVDEKRQTRVFRMITGSAFTDGCAVLMGTLVALRPVTTLPLLVIVTAAA